jgi:biotin carboxyl carrier protein
MTKEKKDKKDKKEKKSKGRKEKKGKGSIDMSLFSELEIGGTVYKTTLPDRFQQKKKWKSKDIGEIEALITGVIKNIFVKKGDAVEKGNCLLLLEAMKMNNEILSPVDGVVQDIFVTENSNVSNGPLMIKIKAEVASSD